MPPMKSAPKIDMPMQAIAPADAFTRSVSGYGSTSPEICVIAGRLTHWSTHDGRYPEIGALFDSAKEVLASNPSRGVFLSARLPGRNDAPK